MLASCESRALVWLIFLLLAFFVGTACSGSPSTHDSAPAGDVLHAVTAVPAPTVVPAVATVAQRTRPLVSTSVPAAIPTPLRVPTVTALPNAAAAPTSTPTSTPLPTPVPAPAATSVPTPTATMSPTLTPAPVPTPGSSPTAAPEVVWAFYVNQERDFVLEHPPDWTVEQTEDGRVDFMAPGGYAVVHVFLDVRSPASVEAWVDETLPGLMEYHSADFELLGQQVKENVDGASSVLLGYRGRPTPESCLSYRLLGFVLRGESSLEVESRVCEEDVEEYQPLVERIIGSLDRIEDGR